MTEKDWLLLITPILCNGILLWIFQFGFKRYFERRDRRSANKKSIYQEFLLLLSECQLPLYNLLHGKYNDFDTRFNNIANAVHQLNLFYQSNSGFLAESNTKIESIFSNWDVIVNTLKRTIDEENRKLDNDATRILNEQLPAIYRNTTELISTYKAISINC